MSLHHDRTERSGGASEFDSAKINQAAEYAVTLRAARQSSESCDQAWNALRLAGLKNIDLILARDNETLASSFPPNIRFALANAVWIVALQQNHLPDGPRRLTAYSLMERSVALDLTSPDRMRTLYEFLGFNLRGLHEFFDSSEAHSEELMAELALCSDTFVRHIAEVYNIRGAALPANLGADRDRRANCALALENATRTIWRTLAYASRTGEPDFPSEQLGQSLEHFAAHVASLHGYSLAKLLAEPSVVRRALALPEFGRNRIARTLVVLAEHYQDRGEGPGANAVRHVAEQLSSTTPLHEDRRFLEFARQARPPALLPKIPEEAKPVVPAPVLSTKQPASPATAVEPAKPLERIEFDARLTWPEIQLLHHDELPSKAPAAVTSVAGDGYAALIRAGLSVTVNLFEQVQMSYRDRLLFERCDPGLRSKFAAHVSLCQAAAQPTEQDLVELVRLHETLNWMLKRPGIPSAERHQIGQIGRSLEKKSRSLAEEYGKRGLLSALHGVLRAAFV